MHRLRSSRIDWTTGAPVDPWSGDGWCDAADPLGEVHHVLLGGNDLPARWRAAARPAARGDAPGAERPFVLGELGLGSGRGLALAAATFDAAAPAGARLHLVSCERAPLSRDDAERALRWAWVRSADADGVAGGEGALPRTARDLLAQWPDPVAGLRTFELLGGRVRGLFVLGEAAETLPRLEFQADAWMLDGFSPGRDASGWTDAVLAAVAARTRPGGTAATWSVAGAVQDGLVRAGFSVTRRPGTGSKKWITAAVREGAGPAVESAAAPSARTAIVAGAGLTGTAVAAALAGRGWSVTVVDGVGPAAGTSSVPRAIAAPVLTPKDGPLGRLRWTAWSRLTAELGWSGPADADADADASGPGTHSACGVLLTGSPRWARIAEALGPDHPVGRWVDPGEASDRAGVRGLPAGLLIPAAGWIDPAALCRRRLDAAGLSVVTGTITSVRRRGGRVEVLGADGMVIAAAEVLVDASAVGLEPVARRRVEAARGAVTFVRPGPATTGLRCVISGRGACLPSHGRPAVHQLGSTFDHHDADRAERGDDHERILAEVGAGAPVLGAALASATRTGAWVGIRRTTRDRAPMVGPPPMEAGADGASSGVTRMALAHGSRGVVGGVLAAELLAAELSGEPVPAFVDDRRAVDPRRRALAGERLD